MASTHCAVCNRRLTDPESIRLGVGPTCASKNPGFSFTPDMFEDELLQAVSPQRLEHNDGRHIQKGQTL